MRGRGGDDRRRDAATARVLATADVARHGGPSSFVVSPSIADGQTISGQGALDGDDRGRIREPVGFYVDGKLSWIDGAPPFSFDGDFNTLDTTTLTNGRHVLRLVATGAAAGGPSGGAATSTSASATVTVDA